MENSTGTTPGADWEKWFRFRYLSSTVFAVVILLFFLPFAEIRCNDTVIASNSGIGMATGQKWNMHGFPGAGDFMDKDKQQKQQAGLSGGMRDWPNILSLVALLAAAGGLAIGVSGSRLRSVITLSAGLLGVLMLVAMMIRLYMEVKSPTDGAADTGAFSKLGSMWVKVSFTIWCYLSIAAFGMAAFIGYKQHKLEEKDALEAVVDFDFQRETTVPEADSNP